jgi:phospholipid/cholesterol/gamma-HCH transport system ATP-binding protein
MPDPIIEARNLVTHYGETKILDGVSMAVERGEIFMIVGGSGCGKTTLLKHLCGLLRPTSGEIIYQGQDITQLDEEQVSRLQRTFGIAYQYSALFNSMTIGENVALPMREYGNMDDTLIEAAVRMKLGMVGLGGAQHMLPDELSGGMRKRAGLARAIALDPPLVFFDEPSSGLDPIMAAGLDELLLNMKRLLGISFVIVTHELESIKKVADRVLMLDKGNVVYFGTPGDAIKCDSDRVRQFFERRPDDVIMQRNV